MPASRWRTTPPRPPWCVATRPVPSAPFCLREKFRNFSSGIVEELSLGTAGTAGTNLGDGLARACRCPFLAPGSLTGSPPRIVRGYRLYVTTKLSGWHEGRGDGPGRAVPGEGPRDCQTAPGETAHPPVRWGREARRGAHRRRLPPFL